MKLVTAKEEFHCIDIVVNDIIDKRRRLPEFVFEAGFGGGLFLAFDRLFTKDFFDRVAAFVGKCEEAAFWLSVVDPDPEQYFVKNFLHFGSLECGLGDSGGDYVSALNRDPGNSPADALIHNSNVVAVGSPSADWMIFGDREADVAVCAFRSGLKRSLFLSIFEPLIFADAVVAARFPFYDDHQRVLSNQSRE